MDRYAITLSGCDDSTTVVMGLDERDIDLVRAIATLTEKVSDCNCMPVLTYRVANERDHADFADALDTEEVSD